jgi:hypothetical protein
MIPFHRYSRRNYFSLASTLLILGIIFFLFRGSASMLGGNIEQRQCRYEIKGRSVQIRAGFLKSLGYDKNRNASVRPGEK